MFALFIDCYHTEVKMEGKVKRASVYIVAGIDLEGKKEPIGIYLHEGAETKERWREIFEDLIQRGLKKVLIIVSDDLPGISNVIKALFPLTDHQLCYVHLERNVKRNMTKEDSKNFNGKLKEIRFKGVDFETSIREFENICISYEKKYPQDIRKFIYTTNMVENINKQIENLRIKIGGYFQSEEIL